MRTKKDTFKIKGKAELNKWSKYRKSPQCRMISKNKKKVGVIQDRLTRAKGTLNMQQGQYDSRLKYLCSRSWAVFETELSLSRPRGVMPCLSGI